jgi:hypothetical protein
MKKTFVALASALTLCLIGQSATAAGSTQATLSADGRMTLMAPGSVAGLGHTYVVPDGLKTIYSTFSDDDSNLYNCCSGWTVSSAGSIVGAKQAVAMPFTPSANVKLKQIVLGIGWVTGVNKVTVSLAEDAGGVPGATLRKGGATDLPTFGSCCDTTAVAVKAIPLSAGTTYWVIATAKKDTWAAWNNNTIGAEGPFAFDAGSGWQATSGNLSAFSVLGK